LTPEGPAGTDPEAPYSSRVIARYNVTPIFSEFKREKWSQDRIQDGEATAAPRAARMARMEADSGLCGSPKSGDTRSRGRELNTLWLLGAGVDVPSRVSG